MRGHVQTTAVFVQRTSRHSALNKSTNTQEVTCTEVFLNKVTEQNSVASDPLIFCSWTPWVSSRYTTLLLEVEKLLMTGDYVYGGE